MDQADPSLTNTLDIPAEFSTQVSTGIPVEIVDAENQGVSLSNDRQNASTEDMDISIESEQKLDSTHLSMVSHIPSLTSVSSAISTLQSSVSTPVKSVVSRLGAAGVPAHSTPASIRPLGNTDALEISADAIPNLGDNLGIEGHGADVSLNQPRQMIGKFGIRLSPSSILNEPSPSSSEDEFDSTDLLNQNIMQNAQDEVTQRLAQAGPIGVAAAAAILSSRKRKRAHTFETNPSVRKRHCSKLTKKLKETLEELTSRVGLQACLVTFRPAKPESKTEAMYKVHGAAPLCNVLKDLQSSVVTEMNTALHQQTPQTIQPKPMGDSLHDLPPLVFDGIPTPVHKMTQAQLRTFIPVMLKSSTGRGKPGWGKEAVKPPWWPAEVPWANVRSDIRTETQKKALAWTDALRRIVLSCYLHHGRIDLLPEFTVEHLQELLSPEAAQQLQVHLETLQQQQQVNGGNVIPAGAGPSGTGATNLGEELGSEQGGQQEILNVSTNQQVFTVDTGMGNCDTSGMPTLADASLAETASRLQQVADETGEVQYATQTVTVTDRDAKALGQPVGSTTTVLLTAYPGGHNGNAATQSEEGGIANAPDSTSGGSFLSTQASSTGNPPNIQVVYGGSGVDATISASEGSTQSSTSAAITTSTVMQVSAANEYLTAAASQELLEATSNISTIPNRGDDGSTDLATQLINQYTAGVASEGGFGGKRDAEDSQLIGTTSAELAPLEGDHPKTSET